MLNNAALTEKKTVLDIRFLPAGIYSVILKDLNGDVKVIRLVKE
jgi:RNase adaptor protein for sRNA GlmZ degradation